MPTERPLRNLARETLLDIHAQLQDEPASRRYNLRKELQADRRSNAVYANRWVTRDQYLGMVSEEMRHRGIELPAAGEQEATAAPVEAATAAGEQADAAGPVEGASASEGGVAGPQDAAAQTPPAVEEISDDPAPGSGTQQPGV